LGKVTAAVKILPLIAATFLCVAATDRKREAETKVHFARRTSRCPLRTPLIAAVRQPAA